MSSVSAAVILLHAIYQISNSNYPRYKRTFHSMTAFLILFWLQINHEARSEYWLSASKTIHKNKWHNSLHAASTTYSHECNWEKQINTLPSNWFFYSTPKAINNKTSHICAGTKSKWLNQSFIISASCWHKVYHMITSVWMFGVSDVAPGDCESIGRYKIKQSVKQNCLRTWFCWLTRTAILCDCWEEYEGCHGPLVP